VARSAAGPSSARQAAGSPASPARHPPRASPVGVLRAPARAWAQVGRGWLGWAARGLTPSLQRPSCPSPLKHTPTPTPDHRRPTVPPPPSTTPPPPPSPPPPPPPPPPHTMHLDSRARRVQLHFARKRGLRPAQQPRQHLALR
jgi:hypothetical protein